LTPRNRRTRIREWRTRRTRRTGEPEEQENQKNRRTGEWRMELEYQITVGGCSRLVVDVGRDGKGLKTVS